MIMVINCPSEGPAGRPQPPKGGEQVGGACAMSALTACLI